MSAIERFALRGFSMTYKEFLERVIDDGIVAARHDYGSRNTPNAGAMLDGSIEGFEACQDAAPERLMILLAEARTGTLRMYRLSHEGAETVEAYWRQRCYEMEIEWVCNVVSATLLNEGKPLIVSPTARGMSKAAEIAGVAA